MLRFSFLLLRRITSYYKSINLLPIFSTSIAFICMILPRSSALMLQEKDFQWGKISEKYLNFKVN